MNADDPRHGTRHGYRDDRCRCDKCRRAIAMEHNIYKLRRSANGGRPLTVPKVGSVRRLQALMALGWPRRELARRAGYKGDAFSPILNGDRAAITLATAQRIKALYDDLSMSSGPSKLTRTYARKAGWPPPLAWDDETIDDPAAIPSGVGFVTPGRAEILADLDHQQAGISTACRHLDITRPALEKWCERHDMTPLYSRLVDREAMRYWANGASEGGVA